VHHFFRSARRERYRIETSQLLLDYLYEFYNRSLEGAKFFASNNLAFPRKIFLDSGGLDSRYRQAAAEDRELCDRWISQGRRLRYTPEASVFHAHPLALGTLWRQHYTYGRGAFFFHRMRAERGGGPVRIEPLSFYLNMFTYPFKHASFISVDDEASGQCKRIFFGKSQKSNGTVKSSGPID
jgi:GT2 family glycosyltransferase